MIGKFDHFECNSFGIIELFFITTGESRIIRKVSGGTVDLNMLGKKSTRKEGKSNGRRNIRMDDLNKKYRLSKPSTVIQSHPSSEIVGRGIRPFEPSGNLN